MSRDDDVVDVGNEPTDLLLRLCRSRDWTSALDHVRTHPEEAAAAVASAAAAASASAGQPLSPKAAEERAVAAASTALAEAVRGGGPLALIRALSEGGADGDDGDGADSEDLLLKILLTTRRFRRGGLLLHAAAAARHVDVEVVHYLVTQIAEREVERKTKSPSSTSSDDVRKEELWRRHIVFSDVDDNGDAIVHLLCRRATSDAGTLERRQWDLLLDAVRIASRASPRTIGMPNYEGLSALTIVLAREAYINNEFGEAEKRTEALVRVLLEAFPGAVSVPPPDHAAVETRSSVMAAMSNRRAALREEGQQGGGKAYQRPRPNVLSLALLHCRSAGVVRRLLSACPMEEARDMVRSIVTPEGETSLHLALNADRRLDAKVVKMLLEDYGGSEIASREDWAGMTPLCWAWARHVVDRPFRVMASRDNGSLPPIKLSRRRYLPTNYSQLLDEAGREIEESTAGAGSGDPDDGPSALDALWEKTELLLPHAASDRHRRQRAAAHRGPSSRSGDGAGCCSLDEHCNGGASPDTDYGPASWPALHAAAYVPSCPRPLLLLALRRRPSQLRQFDARGNLPLHYAASRSGCALPTSVSTPATAVPPGRYQGRRRAARDGPASPGAAITPALYDVLPQFPEGV